MRKSSVIADLNIFGILPILLSCLPELSYFAVKSVYTGKEFFKDNKSELKVLYTYQGEFLESAKAVFGKDSYEVIYSNIVIDSSITSFWTKHGEFGPGQVRFSDGTNSLVFAVESWDATNEEAVFIVEQPALSNSTDLTIYLHFGNIFAAEDDTSAVFPFAIKAYYPLDVNNPNGYLVNMAYTSENTDFSET